MKTFTNQRFLVVLLLFVIVSIPSNSLFAQKDSDGGDTKPADVQNTDNSATNTVGSGETANSFEKTKILEFGITHYLDFTLPEGKGAVVGVKLEKLQGEKRRKLAREYYQNNYYEGDSSFKTESDKVITFKKKNDKTYTLKVPPLEVNRFYKIKVITVDKKNNIYSAFRLMHEEGNDDYFILEKNWMSMIREISANNGTYKLLYTPTLKEMQKYKDWLSQFDLDNLTPNQRIALRDSTLVFFPILKFNPPLFNRVKHFADTIQKIENLRFPQDLDIFNSPDDKNFKSYYDYINIYKFYLEKLKPSFDLNPKKFLNDFAELVKLVNRKLEEKNKENLKSKKKAFIVPTYIYVSDKQEIKVAEEKEVDFSTYTKTFETAHKRHIIPDFGFVTFGQLDSNNFRGTPFVGVNVALSPLNKNVPLALSDKDPLKRMALHVGVTLESISQDKKRDDFFNNKSLMIGLSYKFLTQATRFNVGGILYKDIDAVNGNKSLAAYPYVGLSIDLEIRKWLHGLVPSLTGNFKKE